MPILPSGRYGKRSKPVRCAKAPLTRFGSVLRGTMRPYELHLWQLHCKTLPSAPSAPVRDSRPFRVSVLSPRLIEILNQLFILCHRLLPIIGIIPVTIELCLIYEVIQLLRGIRTDTSGRYEGEHEKRQESGCFAIHILGSMKRIDYQSVYFLKVLKDKYNK